MFSSPHCTSASQLLWQSPPLLLSLHLGHWRSLSRLLHQGDASHFSLSPAALLPPFPHLRPSPSITNSASPSSFLPSLAAPLSSSLYLTSFTPLYSHAGLSPSLPVLSTPIFLPVSVSPPQDLKTPVFFLLSTDLNA